MYYLLANKLIKDNELELDVKVLKNKQMYKFIIIPNKKIGLCGLITQGYNLTRFIQKNGRFYNVCKNKSCAEDVVEMLKNIGFDFKNDKYDKDWGELALENL